MKNLIRLLIMFTAMQVQSQTVEPVEKFFQFSNTNNVYFKDVNNIFEKFLGTWEYINGPHSLRILVTKFDFKQVGINTAGVQIKKIIQYEDFINIYYIYRYNGVTVYDQIPPVSEIINGTSKPGLISGKIVKNANSVDLFYSEPPTTSCMRERNGKLLLTYLGTNNSGKIELSWNRTDKLINIPASFCENGTFDASEYKIPANIILTKINI